MAVTLTTETITGASGETETIVVAREVYNNGTGDDDLEVSIAVDSTAYLDRIATALETIATNSTTIATNSTTIANEITTIDNHIERLKTLGDHPSGPGIRTIQPYGELGFAFLYKNFIEEGGILDQDPDQVLTAEQQQQAVAKFSEYIDNFISDFSSYRSGGW